MVSILNLSNIMSYKSNEIELKTIIIYALNSWSGCGFIININFAAILKLYITSKYLPVQSLFLQGKKKKKRNYTKEIQHQTKDVGKMRVAWFVLLWSEWCEWCTSPSGPFLCCGRLSAAPSVPPALHWIRHTVRHIAARSHVTHQTDTPHCTALRLW